MDLILNSIIDGLLLGVVYGLAAMGHHLRDLGADKLRVLLKMMSMSAVDFLQEWFEHDLVLTDFTSSGIIGTYLGPRSPGTASKSTFPTASSCWITAWWTRCLRAGSAW